MVIRSRENLIGAWAFLVGVILAVLIGILQAITGISASSALLGILIILGVIIGLLNIGGRDINTFLLGAVSLVIVSFAGSSIIGEAALAGIAVGKIVVEVLKNLLVLFVPATIIVALKSFFSVAQS